MANSEIIHSPIRLNELKSRRAYLHRKIDEISKELDKLTFKRRDYRFRWESIDKEIDQIQRDITPVKNCNIRREVTISPKQCAAQLQNSFDCMSDTEKAGLLEILQAQLKK